MILKSVELRDFRNYESLHMEFGMTSKILARLMPIS